MSKETYYDTPKEAYHMVHTNAQVSKEAYGPTIQAKETYDTPKEAYHMVHTYAQVSKETYNMRC